MKKNVIASSILALMLALPAFAETVKVGVDGMVCAFCAQGIEKKFKENPAVESCKVDLDKKEVNITLKKDKKLSDDDVRKAIKEAGYNIRTLERKP